VAGRSESESVGAAARDPVHAATQLPVRPGLPEDSDRHAPVRLSLGHGLPLSGLELEGPRATAAASPPHAASLDSLAGPGRCPGTQAVMY
jgi:hypothetical protein